MAMLVGRGIVIHWSGDVGWTELKHHVRVVVRHIRQIPSAHSYVARMDENLGIIAHIRSRFNKIYHAIVASR